MSTHWGYACESHDPPLVSECWLNHGDEVLIDLFRKERAGNWPTIPDSDPAWGGTPYPLLNQGGPEAIPAAPRSGGGTPPYSAPIEWLRGHRKCDIALRNEYGDRRIIADTVAGLVAGQLLELPGS